jgi:rhamnosyltransferase
MLSGIKASVIIPTKNPGAILRSVLPAVCGQQTAFRFDVLVVDSGSTDGTVEYVRDFDDARVRLHCIAPADFGHGRTRNLAISMTAGEYAVLITHDALPATAQWLQTLVDMADSDTTIAGVFGRHLAYPEADLYTKRDLERHFANFEAEPVVYLGDRERYLIDAGYRQYLHFFSDNNALLRRSAWQAHPYPHVDFAEDQIWAQQVIEAGWKKAYAHQACVYHSHDFKPLELLRRSFDESYALHRLFGYVLSPSLKSLGGTWLRSTLTDLRYGFERDATKRELRSVACRPIRNLMRGVGHYLGSRAERLSPSFRTWLSRDKRMMAGLSSVGNSGEKR